MRMEYFRVRSRCIIQDKRTRISLFSTGVVGLLSYLYYMLNNIDNHDRIQTIPSGIGSSLTNGRWLYFIGGSIAEKIIGTYNVPFLFGLTALFILGLVSLILIHIFEIENYTMCFVLSAITVSFPAIVTQMFYSFTIHYFMFAILLGIAGVYFLKYFCEKSDMLFWNKKVFYRKSVGIIIAALVCQAYKSYILLFLEPYCQINATDLTKLCIMGIGIFCLLTLIFLWKKNDIFKVVELCVFLALLPLASNFSWIMAPEATMSNNVLMGVISIFYLPIVIYEKIDYKRINIKNFSRTALSVVIMLVVVNYIWLANVNYRALYYANRKMENYYTTMWTRITSSKDYRENMKVTFVGKQINDESFFEYWNMPVYKYDGNIIANEELNIYSRAMFFVNYLGHDYREITDEEYQKYQDTIVAMDTYPNDNSIQVIDDLVLVRLE